LSEGVLELLLVMFLPDFGTSKVSFGGLSSTCS
jgi:hypothetical protein